MSKLLTLDTRLFEYFQQFSGKISWADKIFIIGAEWLIYSLPVILIVGWFWSRRSKEVCLRAGLAALISFLLFNKPIAILAGRARPSASLLGVHELVFHRPDTSFPSDHAAVFFAVALTIRLFGNKRAGNILLIIAGLVSISRICVGVHYPLDVIVGSLIGCFSAILIWTFRKQFDHFITNPLIAIARKVRL
jgi:undecaprenyl-diphosphatase